MSTTRVLSKNKHLKLTGVLLLSLLVGCSRKFKPDQITTIKSPIDGVFYTVETYHGQGAIDNDYTKVYLHKERSGQSAKALVLAGVYVTVSKIQWANSTENTIYFDGGFTDTFCNQVTLSLGGVSETFHAQLIELPPATGSK